MISELKNEFEKLKSTSNDFSFLFGNKQIVISAPHAVPQTRNGDFKFPEPETAIFALFFNKKDYPCIIKTKNNSDDSNFDKISPYKDFLYQYCLDKNIKFVLDIHQLSKNKDVEICIGTGRDKFNNLLHLSHLKQKIKNIFETGGFYTELDEPFGATGENTVSGFVSRKGIPSIQLEINSKLLFNVTDDEFFKVANCIQNVLTLIEKELKNENTDCN